MHKIKIKVLTKADWRIYKSIRLRSLIDSPDSFGSTFEQENALKDEEWSSRIDYPARNLDGLLLVAELNGNPVGLACGMIHSPGVQDGYVYQMWVTPENRGLGAGKLLLMQLIRWAKNKNLKKLSLSVVTSNAAAINLYRTLGFKLDGELELLRDGSYLKSQPMALQLD